MNTLSLPINFGNLALLAEVGEPQSHFEFARIHSIGDWFLYGTLLAAILVYVVWMYIRDTVDLPVWACVALTLLRAAAFGGLFVLFLQPSWPQDREIRRKSRVLLLVDTSPSMGPGIEEKGPSRLEQITRAADSSDFLAKLRTKHDVIVYPFNDALGDRIADEGKWASLLTIHGKQTGLGNALNALIAKEEDPYVSGIIVFSDGCNNGSDDPVEVAKKARQADIPIYTVGLGSEAKKPKVTTKIDVTCALGAPPTAFLRDSYTVTAFLPARSTNGDRLDKLSVELFSRPGKKSDKGSILEDIRIASLPDIAVPPDADKHVRIELTVPGRPDDKPGFRTLRLEFKGYRQGREVVSSSKIQMAPGANLAEVELTERTPRILLLAGGPTRDYQYLRTQLFRDDQKRREERKLRIEEKHKEGKRDYSEPEIPPTVDVLLQSRNEVMVTKDTKPDESKEANNVLDELPSKREDFMRYDCIVAFDPDWQRLGPPAEGGKHGLTTQRQIDLLEEWVFRGGGLIVVGGPVYTGQPLAGWAQGDKPEDKQLEKIRNLYPVEFLSSGVGGETASFPSAWPLSYSEASCKADYLWVDGLAEATEQVRDEVHVDVLILPVIEALQQEREAEKRDKIKQGLLQTIERALKQARAQDQKQALEGLRQAVMQPDGKAQDDALEQARGRVRDAMQKQSAERLSMHKAIPQVYGFCPVRALKRGAKPLAWFSDPRTAQADPSDPKKVVGPVFLAEQYYGQGRVFYMGSGEVWRLRGADTTYFDQFYTKLLRHVSQGRLTPTQTAVRVHLFRVQPGEYWTGEFAEVEAEMTGPGLEPLPMSKVTVKVAHKPPAPARGEEALQPDKPSELELTRDPLSPQRDRYVGKLPLLSPGEYELTLSLPGQKDVWKSSAAVKKWDPEKNNAGRNDKLLTAIAGARDGYYLGMAAATRSEAVTLPASGSEPEVVQAALTERLKDMSKTRTERLPKPDEEKEWDLLRWMMLGICGLLCLEWLIRRLARLA